MSPLKNRPTPATPMSKEDLNKAIDKVVMTSDNLEKEAQQAAEEVPIVIGSNTDIDLEEINTAAQPPAQPKAKLPTMTNKTVMDTASNVHVDARMTPEEIDAAEKKRHNFESFMHPATAKAIEGLMNNQNIDWSKVDERYIMDEAFIAIDFKLPSHLDVKAKDPAYMLRWVYVKPTKEGGNRYDQMRALGFVNARPEELAGPLDYSKVKDQDGAIICQDLICMIIPKALLFGYYKNNYIKSNKMFDPRVVQQKGKESAKAEFRHAAQQAGINPELYRGRIGFFQPNRIPSMMGDDLEG